MGRCHIYQWIVGSFVDVAFDDQQSYQICRLALEYVCLKIFCLLAWGFFGSLLLKCLVKGLVGLGYNNYKKRFGLVFSFVWCHWHREASATVFDFQANAVWVLLLIDGLWALAVYAAVRSNNINLVLRFLSILIKIIVKGSHSANTDCCSKHLDMFFNFVHIPNIFDLVTAEAHTLNPMGLLLFKSK